MRIPSVGDATVRYLALTTVGVLMLLLRPGFAEHAPLTNGLDTTLWSVVGVFIVAAAWAYFTVVVTFARGLRCRNPLCRVLVLLSLLSVVGFAVATLTGVGVLQVPLLVCAMLLQLVMAAGLQRGAAVESPLTREAEVASLP